MAKNFTYNIAPNPLPTDFPTRTRNIEKELKGREKARKEREKKSKHVSSQRKKVRPKPKKPPISKATADARWAKMVAESKKKDEALLSKGQPLPTGNIHERLGRGRTPQPQAVPGTTSEFNRAYGGGGDGGQLTYEQQVNQRAMQIVQESIQAAGQRPEDKPDVYNPEWDLNPNQGGRR